MNEWSVEVAPGATAAQVGGGLFKLRVAIYLDYHVVAKCELTLTADQIQPLYSRSLAAASGSEGARPDSTQREGVAR